MKNAYMLDFEVNLQKKIHYGTLCISTYCKKLVWHAPIILKKEVVKT